MGSLEHTLLSSPTSRHRLPFIPTEDEAIQLPGGVRRVWITAEVELRLEDVTVLKVGHHGSWNATPRRLVQALKKPVTSLLSTQAGISGDNPVKEVRDRLAELGRVIRSDERDPDHDSGGGWRDCRGGRS